MKKLNKNKKVFVVIASIALIPILLFGGFISGVLPFAYGTLKCGHLPVKSSNFAASYSYDLPGDKEYGFEPLSDYEFCTAKEAEAEGYHRIIFDY
ncbi:hypothetical protein HY004_01390 [Candidatus Saccharibacteria bacterium]|nr:hypothetical protein [Candidatus Saccharibacteria bacterium]